MKLLLTSGGVTNASIKRSLYSLAGKSRGDMKIAFILTAAMVEQGDKEWLIQDMYRLRKAADYVDVLDIAQLTEAQWRPRLEAVDVIFVSGGNPFYLSYWMQRSGLMAALPALLESRVYAGLSAGSMVASKSLRTSFQSLQQDAYDADEYVEFGPAQQTSTATLEFVPFAILPHVHSIFAPQFAEARIEKAVQQLSMPIYALDDDSAIQIDDGEVTVISEGDWKLYE